MIAVELRRTARTGHICEDSFAYGSYSSIVEEANVPRPFAGHPPKLSGCGKLQIVILSGKKIEKSSTHDFALHISASYKPRQPCLAILIYIY